MGETETKKGSYTDTDTEGDRVSMTENNETRVCLTGHNSIEVVDDVVLLVNISADLHEMNVIKSSRR